LTLSVNIDSNGGGERKRDKVRYGGTLQYLLLTPRSGPLSGAFSSRCRALPSQPSNACGRAGPQSAASRDLAAAGGGSSHCIIAASMYGIVAYAGPGRARDSTIVDLRQRGGRSHLPSCLTVRAILSSSRRRTRDGSYGSPWRSMVSP